jgi:hypothetical protein
MDENIDPAEKYNKIYRSRGRMILDNFLGGIAWSLGTFFGAAVVVGIIVFILSRIDLVPIIGSWIAQIIEDATSRIQLPTQIPIR